MKAHTTYNKEKALEGSLSGLCETLQQQHTKDQHYLDIRQIGLVLCIGSQLKIINWLTARSHVGVVWCIDGFS